MRVDIDSVKSSPYSNMDLTQNSETRRGDETNLKALVDLMPNKIFEERAGSVPKSRGVADASETFLDIAKRDAGAAKSVIKSYPNEVNGAVGKVAALKRGFVGKSEGRKACPG